MENQIFDYIVVGAGSAGPVLISLRFKPVAGRIDQGAGILFNLKPNGGYLLVRANALENNLVLFKYEKGKRSSVKWIRNTPTPSGQWQDLKVRISGAKVEGYLNGKLYLEEVLPAPVSGMVEGRQRHVFRRLSCRARSARLISLPATRYTDDVSRRRGLMGAGSFASFRLIQPGHCGWPRWRSRAMVGTAKHHRASASMDMSPSSQLSDGAAGPTFLPLCRRICYAMALNLLPLGALGAVESNGAVTFGLWLPWVSSADGNTVTVKIIHETDQFLQGLQPKEFPLTHSVRPPYGDFWSGTVQIAGTTSAPGSAWGSLGRYVYRYTIVNPNIGTLDWIIDPFAREFGVGKLSAFTLGYQPYSWSAAEAQWRTPPLSDLILYEINVAEFAGDLDRTHSVVAYLRDLGVNAVEIMPLSNVASSVDWGYLPIGYFGVDERFGNRSDFQQLVDIAHQHSIAVIVDAVYGHTGVDFPYYDAYTRLQYHENPFMGPFAKDYFSDFGKSTDFNRQLTRDYFLSVNHHWLEVYHVDGFRYDCVPNYWDGPLGVGYASLVYETYQLTKDRIQQGRAYWNRFDPGDGGSLRLVQMAEQLEGPEEVLRTTYSNSTWQNRTFDLARSVARGNRGQLADWGLSLGLFGYPEQESTNGDVIPKLALQYTENHDHERFLCNFGLQNPDEAGNPLFLQGDRRRWYMLQPYLIALLMSKGIPMLWQGEEFSENYFLPDFGAGRVSLLRPLRWDYFYDTAGQSIVQLVRKLIRIRRDRSQIRRGAFFFFNDWERYQRAGIVLFARYDAARYTLVGINTSDTDQTVPFWFPLAGNYVEELHGGNLNLTAVPSLQEVALTIPPHYGRVWTAVGS